MQLENYPDADQRTEFLKQFPFGSLEYLAARKALYWCLDKLDKCLAEARTKGENGGTL